MYADRYNAILTPDIYEKWVGAIKGDRDHWIELNSTMIRISQFDLGGVLFVAGWIDP
jgi:hypothetical protein